MQSSNTMAAYDPEMTYITTSEHGLMIVVIFAAALFIGVVYLKRRVHIRRG